MDKKRSMNASSSSARNLIKNFKKTQDKEDDGYSSSQSDNSYSQEEIEAPPIDITKYLPPANPLIPKMFQEDYEVRTAINIQFASLPNFNKNKKYLFIEPSERPLQLQEYMAQQQSIKASNNTYENKVENINMLKQENRKQNSKSRERIILDVAAQSVQLNNQQTKNNLQIQFENSSQENISNQAGAQIPTTQQIANTTKNISLDKDITKNQQKDSEPFLKVNGGEQNKEATTQQTIVQLNPLQQQQQQQQQQSQQQIALNNQNLIVQQQQQQQTQQQQNPVKMKYLLDYHRQNKDNLIYKKFTDIDLNEPTQINNTVYFATYLANLKTLIKSRTENNQSFDQRKASFNRKVSIKEMQNHHNANSSSATQQSGNIKQQIEFSSNFESGNLFSAYKVNENEFDLILQNDINTKGNTQWFFFNVVNAKAGQVLKFNILNLVNQLTFFIQRIYMILLFGIFLSLFL